MRSPRRVVVLVVLLAAVGIPTNQATAQADGECAGSNRALFSEVRPPRLTVTRDGAIILILQFEPGALVGVCYERRGPRGEMAGDVVISATPGTRTNPSDRRTVSDGGAPVIVSLRDVLVTP